MADDLIRYDILVQEALRGVVRKVLSEVVKTGLPGEHHFYISFFTKAPGVRMSQRLLDQYDKEMTIVLQNQYWDLKVTDTGFEVGLSFDGHPEILAIPFSAMKGFFDPSVQFGLQLNSESAAMEAITGGAAPQSDEGEPSAADADPDIIPPPEGGDKVVSLDHFRKKP